MRARLRALPYLLVVLVSFLYLGILLGCPNPTSSSSSTNNYTVTYNVNGATSGSVPTDNNKYQTGATVTVLGNTGNLVMTGATFAGWNTKADGTGTTYAGGATFTMGSANVILYVLWSQQSTFSVTYNVNGTPTSGSVPTDNNKYQPGAAVTVLGNTGNLVMTGTSFAGWNTKADGTGTTYAGGATFTMGSANVILYAVWIGSLGISASSGTLSGSGGSWTFNAGTVPQYTTNSATFKVTNPSSVDFSATGSQTFTNNDFSDSLSGTFDVKPYSASSFTGSFTPTAKPGGGAETGTLTLTPSTGSPITISLSVTPDASFQVFDWNGLQIVPPTAGTVIYSGTSTLTITNTSATATITLTGGPNYVTVTGTNYSVAGQPVNATQQVVSSIGPSSSVTFQIQDTNLGGGNTGTITISGVDSTSGAPFTFVGTVVDRPST